MSELREQAAVLTAKATDIEYYLEKEHHLAALSDLKSLGDLYVVLAQEVAQAAFNNGATKRRIAEALGVPARTFTGMEKTT